MFVVEGVGHLAETVHLEMQLLEQQLLAPHTRGCFRGRWVFLSVCRLSAYLTCHKSCGPNNINNAILHRV